MLVYASAAPVGPPAPRISALRSSILRVFGRRAATAARLTSAFLSSVVSAERAERPSAPALTMLVTHPRAGSIARSALATMTSSRRSASAVEVAYLPWQRTRSWCAARRVACSNLVPVKVGCCPGSPSSLSNQPLQPDLGSCRRATYDGRAWPCRAPPWSFPAPPCQDDFCASPQRKHA